MTTVETISNWSIAYRIAYTPTGWQRSLNLLGKFLLTWFVIRLRAMAAGTLVSQWIWRGRLRRWFCWASFWGTLRAPPWHSRSCKVEVCPPGWLVIRASARRFSIKFHSTPRITVELGSFVITPLGLVVVCTSTRVEVVIRGCRPSGVVAPSVGVGRTTSNSGAPVALGRTPRCVTGCAVCFYELNLQKKKKLNLVFIE